MSANRDSAKIKWFVRKFYRDHCFDEETLTSLASRPVRFQYRVLTTLSWAARPFVGSPFPRKWEDMHPMAVPHCLTCASDAFALTAAKLAFLSTKLNKALAAQIPIETALILGQLDTAKRLLGEFEVTYGHSLWSLDLSFLRSQLFAGYHGNRTTLSLFLDTSNSDWVNFLSQNSSFRAQLNVSTHEYINSLNFLFADNMVQARSSYAIDYLRYRFFGDIPSTEGAVCNILHFESRHSFLDQYVTFLRLVTARTKIPFEPRTAEGILLLASQLADSRIRNLGFLACSDLPDCNSQDLFLCISKHVEEDHLACLDMARRMILDNPTAFILYDLVAHSAASLSDHVCPAPFAEDSIAGQLLSTLFDWYSARSPRRESLEQLRRFARALNPTRLGPAIASFVALFDQQSSPLGGEQVSPLATPVPIPQFAYSFSSTANAVQYVNHFAALLGDVAGVSSVRRYLSLRDGAPIDDSLQMLPRPAALRYQAAARYAAGDLNAAASSLKELRGIAPEISHHHPELYVAEATALLSLGEYEGAVSLMAELFCVDRRLLPPVLLRQAAQLLFAPAFTPCKSNIAWPIIAVAAYCEDAAAITLDRVHDFVSDFIESQEKTRPSELLQPNDNPVPAVLVFLKECCTPDILESSIWFASQEELLKERLLLCQHLHDTSQIADPDVLREIADLTRRLAVLDLTSRIERSRVYIDSEAILGRLDEATWSQTNSLLSVRALRNKELQRGLKLLGFPTSEGGRLSVVIVDQGRSFFDEVFNTIRQQFLNSPELGLDANLSQRIRHGTLAGELRAPFDRSGLSTRKQSNGMYEPNNYWMQTLAAHNDEQASLNQLFGDFSATVDDHIRRVREDWIQIRAEAKPYGLFDYSFSDEELQQLLDSISPLAEHAEVHEAMLAALYRRTEICLQAVRSALATTLVTYLTNALDTLLTSVDRLDTRNPLNVVPLRDAITACKTDMIRQVGRIQDWFHVENRHEQKHFHFRHLVESVEEILNRINTRCSVSLIQEGDDNVPIPGRFFRPLWDLLVILFDNASRHSGVEGPGIAVRVVFESGATSITCENEMSPSSNMDGVRRHVGQLNTLSLTNQSDLNKLRQEGGTGTAKLHKIVRHELGRDESEYGIAFAISEDNKFQVDISLKAGLIDAHFGN